MSRYRPRHAQRHRARRLLQRAVVPGGVLAVLASGVAVAAWPDQPADTAEPAVATPGRPAPDALRTDRPNRGTERTALPSTSARPSSSSSQSSAPARSEADRSSGSKRAEKKTKPKQLGATVGKVVGQRYTTDDVRLRFGAGTSYGSAKVVEQGQKISVTDQKVGQWTQVVYSGDARWVKSRLLTTKKPASSADGAASTDGVSSKACSSGSSVENGLTPDAIKVHRAICAAFPQVKSFGGVRADSLPEHPSGRAVDAMISDSSVGWQIARWVQAHRKELGVSQILYSQKIWTVQRSSEGWRSMPDRGGATANHYDHVHVTVYGSAAS